MIEFGVSLIQHVDHLHGRNLAAYLSEVDDVREQNGYRRIILGRTRIIRDLFTMLNAYLTSFNILLSDPQFVGNLFGDVLIEHSVSLALFRTWIILIIWYSNSSERLLSSSNFLMVISSCLLLCSSWSSASLSSALCCWPTSTMSREKSCILKSFKYKPVLIKVSRLNTLGGKGRYM